MNETAAAIALDPITVEVIGAALSSIVEETGEALIRASFSFDIFAMDRPDDVRLFLFEREADHLRIDARGQQGVPAAAGFQSRLRLAGL